MAGNARTPLLASALLAALIGLGHADAALAQVAPAEAPAPVALAVPQEMQSPRATLRAFLTRMADDEKKQAAELLDLSGLNAEAAAAKGPELAYKLFETMRRLVHAMEGEPWPPTEEFAFVAVPDDPDYQGSWKLAALDRYSDESANDIEIARGPDGRWLFTAETVQRIERFYDVTEKAEPKSRAAADAKTTEPFTVWFGKLFPEPLRKNYFVMPGYQWLCLLAFALIGRQIDAAFRWSLTRGADALLRRADPEFQDSTARVWRPVGRLANAASWYVGASVLGLPLEVVGVLLTVLRVVTIAAAIWAAFAVINLVASYFSRRAKRHERRFDDMLVPLVATTAKVVLCVVSGVAVFTGFGAELPTTLLGGLGIGGIAIALASQETLSNFFGSVTVLLDRPFEVGDWVVVDGFEGEVESVGFRSTKLRTGINSQVTLPNNKLATAAIDNWGRRRYRRYLTRLGLEYGTDPEAIEAFCEGIRELIRRHPHTRKDFYAAYLNEFGASSLEVLLVVFFEAPDWATELRERHRLLADVARLAKRLGVAFAFPTQTLHLLRDEPADPASAPEDPDRTGQRLAAEIAGELANYQDRPGRVKFPTAPTPID